MISGHCECGRITFEIDGVIEDFSHCHCSQCRRMHGAAYATFAGVAAGAFRIVTGEDNLAHYASSATHDRTFCVNCGSNVYVSTTSEPEAVYVSMGAIDGNPPRPRGYHIYVGSKAPWHGIDDDLPRFDTEPDD